MTVPLIVLTLAVIVLLILSIAAGLWAQAWQKKLAEIESKIVALDRQIAAWKDTGPIEGDVQHCKACGKFPVAEKLRDPMDPIYGPMLARVVCTDASHTPFGVVVRAYCSRLLSREDAVALQHEAVKRARRKWDELFGVGRES